MPHYAYDAYDSSGRRTSGEVRASSDLTALAHLTARGLTPVSLTVAGQLPPWWQRDLSLSGQAHVKPQALTLFFRSFASLLSVGFPVPRALRFCVGITRDLTLRRALEHIADTVSDGNSLAQALRTAGGNIPERLVVMIEIGEASNRLADVTRRIAVTLEIETARAREIRAALVYPMILVAMSLIVLGVLVFYLAPTLMPVFASAASRPPWILQQMTDLRDALVTSWPIWVAAAILFAVLLKMGWLRLSRLFAPVILRLPLIGPYLRQSETLRLCRTLTLMLSSGATLPRALTVASQTAGHPAYQALLSNAEEAVTAGAPLSKSLSQSLLIDPMATALLEAAEEADHMITVLDKLAEEMSDRTARTLDQAIKLITPGMTLVIGLGVGGVILSTIAAILSLNDVAF